MKEATQKEIKEYLKTSRTRNNLNCTYCLNLRGSRILGEKVKMVMIKSYIKEGKHYAWSLICPRCEAREVLGY